MAAATAVSAGKAGLAKSGAISKGYNFASTWEQVAGFLPLLTRLVIHRNVYTIIQSCLLIDQMLLHFLHLIRSCIGSLCVCIFF